MSIKISLKKNISNNQVKNYVLFCDENLKIYGFDKISIGKYHSDIKKLLSFEKLDKKDFLFFNINPFQKIILVKLKKSQSSVQNEKIGGKFFDYVKSNSFLNLTFLMKNIKEITKNKIFLDEFVHGIKIKSYEFKKYKSNVKKMILILLFQLIIHQYILTKIKDMTL